MRRDIFHFIYTQFLMRRWLPRAGATAWLLAAFVASSCASPPNKEIAQAQGAIDAARAAGAEQYATAEHNAATTSLKQANDAVAQRDYRLALNYALESREHAQNAARDAADTRARIRGDVERLMAEINVLRTQANSRMTTAQNAGVPRARLRAARQTLAQINKDVQEPIALMKQGDYTSAQPKLAALKLRLEKLSAAITAATAPRRVRAARES
jgi:maltooligosyltrehalose synthase